MNANITEIWQGISPKARKIWFIGICLAMLLTFGALIGAFSMKGMLGLFRWVIFIRIGIIFLIVLTAFLPVIGVLDFYIASKRTKRPIRAPSRVMWVLILGLVLFPSILMGVMAANLNTRAGDSPPQLIMLDGNHSNGMPIIAIVYRSATPRIDTLHYGIGNLDLTISDTIATNNHIFVFPTLTPNSIYQYRVNDGTIFEFKTPTGLQQVMKFAVTSDPHIGFGFSNLEATNKISALIGNPTRQNEVFFLLGDVVENGFSDKEWVYGLNALHSLTATMPIRTCVGNHDAMFGGDKFYLDYFYPNDAPTVSGTQFYQRMDLNGIHFLILDVEWGTEYYFGEQENWLKTQLADINTTDPNGWTIVMSHGFYYASGSFAAGTPWVDNEETISALVPLFKQYDVDLVLSGHIHDMQLLEKDGINYAIVGAYGGALEPDANIDSVATSLFHNNKDFGFLEVDIQGAQANLSFYNQDATLLKSHVISK
jgi:predicted MPP superfamily phosphohydrolase